MYKRAYNHVTLTLTFNLDIEMYSELLLLRTDCMPNLNI